jgi:4-coumarate--CoA ligase
VVAHFERAGGAARIGFETSGSTGNPKRVVHSADVLAEEVEEHLTLGTARPRERVLSAVPPRHIYGFLWSVLLPQTTGAPVVDLHRSTGEALFRICRPGDLVIGTPFTWERTAQSGGRLPADVCGVTSGGPSTAKTWKAAVNLGLERFVEIYGSTETGGIGWRHSEDVPFRLFGRISRSRDGSLRRRSGDALVVQDNLTWNDDGTFHVGSRRDGMVQVAGANVSLEAVAALLCTVAGVADAVVRLDGIRVMAVVVPDGPDADLDGLEDTLRARVRRELPVAARPDRYRFDEAIPRNAMGKVTTW